MSKSIITSPKALAAAGLVACLALPLLAQPGLAHHNVLGGVNLNAYCKTYHGSGARAVVVANNAGGWRCETPSGDQFGISVQTACENTYRPRPIKARVIGADLPGNWRCVRGRWGHY